MGVTVARSLFTVCEGRLEVNLTAVGQGALILPSPDLSEQRQSQNVTLARKSVGQIAEETVWINCRRVKRIRPVAVCHFFGALAAAGWFHVLPLDGLPFPQAPGPGRRRGMVGP